jgi:hypothetical protein
MAITPFLHHKAARGKTQAPLALAFGRAGWYNFTDKNKEVFLR